MDTYKELTGRYSAGVNFMGKWSKQWSNVLKRGTQFLGQNEPRFVYNSQTVAPL